jgi:hypothetical protein
MAAEQTDLNLKMIQNPQMAVVEDCLMRFHGRSLKFLNHPEYLHDLLADLKLVLHCH